MKFVNGDNLRYLLERLVEMIDQKTQVNIISQIDEDSTNQQIPGAKAVRDLLVAGLAGIIKLTAETVDALPPAGETNVIYLIHEGGNKYHQYMYIGGAWADLGVMAIDLSGYWKKNDLEALTSTEIQEIIDDVMGV
jgi:hypothetical protein